MFVLVTLFEPCYTSCVVWNNNLNQVSMYVLLLLLWCHYCHHYYHPRYSYTTTTTTTTTTTEILYSLQDPKPICTAQLPAVSRSRDRHSCSPGSIQFAVSSIVAEFRHWGSIQATAQNFFSACHDSWNLQSFDVVKCLNSKYIIFNSYKYFSRKLYAF